MFKEYEITKPTPVRGYQLHALVQTLTNGASPLFADRGDRIIVRTDAALPFPDRPIPQLKEGEIAAFALDACVCKKTRGKRSYYPTSNLKSRKEWLRSKAATAGFEIVTIHVSPAILTIDDSKERKFTVDNTTFTGVLRVKDAAAFNHALVNGIGSAKAFGLGLLQI